MCFNKNIFQHFCLVVLSLLFVQNSATSQIGQYDSTTFRIIAEIGTGISYKLNAPESTFGDYTRSGVAGSFRLKWSSSNRLAVGIETGWFPISLTTNPSVPSEFGNIGLDASLSAVPVLAVLAMQPMGVQIHAGLGYYRINSRVSLAGITMQSSEWDLGFMVAAGYAVPVSQQMRLGAEMKMFSITEQKISVGLLQVKMMYRLFGD